MKSAPARMLVILTLLALPLALTGCGGEDTAFTGGGLGATCATHNECGDGLGCIDTKCRGTTCVVLTECGENQVCLPTDTGGVCTDAECGCPTCAPCPAGTECSATGDTLGYCMSPDERPATGTDAGTAADSAAASGCAADCGPGKICDSQTGQCVPASNAGFICNTCGTNDDCGGTHDRCSPLTSGYHCTLGCAAESDCPVGYTCYEATNEGKQCVPFSYKCEECITDGCPAGQICNYGTGSCQAPRPACANCAFDFECSADGSQLCYEKAAGQKFCAPACGEGDTCPGDAQCVTASSGRKVCAFASNTCCYGDNCGTCNCSGSTPYCLAGNCVQCLQDTDCESGTGPCEADNTCAGGAACLAPTPYSFQGTCVECLNSTHCTGGACDLTTHTCTNDACSVCAAPYPACTDIGGQFTCVQCTAENDTFCTNLGGVCDANTFTCQGVTVPVGTCKTDADCTDANPFGPDPLQCHVASGACIDPNGSCDGVIAQCPSGTCFSLMDIFLGGAGGGGLPLPPGPGGAVPGVCTCQQNSDCAGSSACLDPATNPLFQILPVGQMIQEPICFDCAALGGGSGGMGDLFSMACQLLSGGGGFPLPGFP